MKSKMFISLIGLLAVMGCKEVKIVDGRVPQEYLSQAKQLEGTYYGEFDGKKAQVTLRFEGDKPVLDYSDQYGRDVLDESCHSKIDVLKTVQVRDERSDNPYIDKASFGFHPGSCREVNGRTIDLEFKGANQFRMSIYDHSDYYNNCNGGPGYPPPRGGGNCSTQEVPRYISGKFQR